MSVSSTGILCPMPFYLSQPENPFFRCLFTDIKSYFLANEKKRVDQSAHRPLRPRLLNPLPLRFAPPWPLGPFATSLSLYKPPSLCPGSDKSAESSKPWEPS